jgi:hypothetical protein
MKKIFILTLIVFFASCKKEETVIAKAPIFQGDYVGTYTGADFGTWNFSLDSDKNISGIGSSTKYNNTFSGTGTCDNLGNITFGSVSSGSTFTGIINSLTYNVTGTWANTSLNSTGVFSGFKK